VCDACWRASAAGIYDGPLRSIIHAFKYDGRRSLAKPLARLVRERHRDLLADVDAAVPVPLHWVRRISRGFNQAEDLARCLGLPVTRALKRVRSTAPQAELAGVARAANVRAAFAPTHAAASLRGKVVLVVDDVVTTGATMEACALALCRCGVREVRTIAAARAVLRGEAALREEVALRGSGRGGPP
jgi:ComF family protein